MSTPYHQSLRNDEHDEDSFESFIKPELTGDEARQSIEDSRRRSSRSPLGQRRSIHLADRDYGDWEKRRSAQSSAQRSRTTRLVIFGSVAVMLIASLGVFSSGVAGNGPISLPSSMSDLAFWKTGSQYGWGSTMEACGMCASAPEVCAQYGRSAIELSRAYTGSGARVQRVLAKAARGEKIVIGVLGGSVSEGVDVPELGRWHEVVQGWFNTTFPDIEVELQNGAVPGRGTEYFMSCHAEHINRDADLVLIELGINDWHAGHPYDECVSSFHTEHTKVY